jgi:hypothetical protein
MHHGDQTVQAKAAQRSASVGGDRLGRLDGDDRRLGDRGQQSGV